MGASPRGKLADLVGRTLEWRAAGFLGTACELCLDGEPVAVLREKGLTDSEIFYDKFD